MISARELERRRKIGEANRGRRMPDLAAYNSTEAARSRPRTRSEQGLRAVIDAKTEHGHARSRGQGRGGTKTYYTWAAMIQRCTNPSNKSYYLYGGRGIGVCDSWRRFANFLADMGPKPDGLTLDRIDNDGNYEPGNCRWATIKQQAANTRKNTLTDDGVAYIRANPDMTLAELAAELGVGVTTVARVRRREGRFA